MTAEGWERRLDDLARAQERAEGLREAIARWLCERRNDGGGWDHEPGRRYWLEDADALLAGPLAPLLEAQAAVQRVEVIARQMRQDGVDSYAEDRDEAARARAVALYYAADQLFAALAGPS